MKEGNGAVLAPFLFVRPVRPFDHRQYYKAENFRGFGISLAQMGFNTFVVMHNLFDQKESR